MHEITRIAETETSIVGELAPLPQLPAVRVRDARPEDLPFIDSLQKKHSKAVGWMPTGQLEGHIAKGHVIIAEMSDRGSGIGDVGGEAVMPDSASDIPDTPSHIPHPPPGSARPLGYCIGVDKYFKREDVGIIYQMNIAPGSQRGYLGANLLQAMFDRWPYGVRLCCCWCAQDLQANYFWEAMGFVPLAFRAGSRKRDRVHIFWQKQVRKAEQATEGPRSVSRRSEEQEIESGFDSTPFWFPSQTGSGALKEDRIVLPIPPGVHWSDAKPRVLPEVSGLLEERAQNRKAIEQESRKAKRQASKAKQAEQQAKAEAAAKRASTVAAGGLRFGPAPPAEQKNERTEKQKMGVKPQKSEAQGSATAKKASGETSGGKPKNDPRLVAAARELRDRYLEQINAQPGLLPLDAGKYEVSRALDARPSALAALRGPMKQMQLPGSDGEAEQAA